MKYVDIQIFTFNYLIKTLINITLGISSLQPYIRQALLLSTLIITFYQIEHTY